MQPRYSDLASFVSVADQLSFRRAARHRGTTASAVSHALQNLEAVLGVRLVNRTSRSVSLTEAGSVLYARLKPAFGEISHAVDAVNSYRETPFGTLKLNVPRAVGNILLGPVIARLLRQHPGLSLEVSSDDRLVDIVAEGYDAGIRFGERLAQDMVAVRIDLPLHWAVIGAPNYIAALGAPGHPGDLHRHDCIGYRFPSGVALAWEFEKDGHTVQVPVKWKVALDDQDLMIEAAASGAGLAFVFAERAAPHIASGRVVRCLQEWCPALDDLFLYYPARSHMPASLRVLIDVLRRPTGRSQPG